LIAAQHSEAPFTKLLFVDLLQENIDALSARLSTLSKTAGLFRGDCNDAIDELIKQVPVYGLNIALIDPFAASAVSFETIKALAARDRMDLIIHFPMGDLKRNFRAEDKKHFEGFLGLPESQWGLTIRKASDVPKLIGVLRQQLAKLGYTPRDLTSPAVKNTTNTVLYHLVYATKNKLGNKIWASITRINAKGQKSFNFDDP
jgi:three-Cys-motif partner protein